MNVPGVPIPEGPQFEPPYLNRAHELFAWNIVKYLAPTAKLHKQHEIQTICGPYTVAFVAEVEGKKVGFEIGDVNDDKPDEGEWRDAVIMGCTGITCIYRLTEKDLRERL